MIVLAIDPGPVESAYVFYDAKVQRPIQWKKAPNKAVRLVAGVTCPDVLAIEMIASYGMPVGAEVFQTCVAIGRFIERYGGEPRLLTRKAVVTHLCGSAKAKDANVRQVLIDRFGPGKELAIGKKATPGPLYGMNGDCWAALAVAVTAAETGEL